MNTAGYKLDNCCLTIAQVANCIILKIEERNWQFLSSVFLCGHILNNVIEYLRETTCSAPKNHNYKHNQ